MYNDDDAGTRFAVARVQLSVFTARQKALIHEKTDEQSSTLAPGNI